MPPPGERRAKKLLTRRYGWTLGTPKFDQPGAYAPQEGFVKDKLGLFGIAALLGGFVVAGAGVATAQTVDATHYTIACDTLNKGSLGFKPSLLIPGGAASELIKLKGSLAGCTATPDAGNPAITVVSGSISGLLTGSTNSCTSLLGPSDAAGTITIKWKVAAPIQLLNATTTITVASGHIAGGTLTPFGDTASYGMFTVSGAPQTGPFGGPSGTGAASVTKALTVQGAGGLAALCTSTTGLKAANLGPTELLLQ